MSSAKLAEAHQREDFSGKLTGTVNQGGCTPLVLQWRGGFSFYVLGFRELTHAKWLYRYYRYLVYSRSRSRHMVPYEQQWEAVGHVLRVVVREDPGLHPSTALHHVTGIKLLSLQGFAVFKGRLLHVQSIANCRQVGDNLDIRRPQQVRESESWQQLASGSTTFRYFRRSFRGASCVFTATSFHLRADAL